MENWNLRGPAAVAVASDRAGQRDAMAMASQGAEGGFTIWEAREGSSYLSCHWEGLAPAGVEREPATAAALLSTETGLVATGGCRGSVRLCQLNRDVQSAVPLTVAASYTPGPATGCGRLAVQ